MEDNLVVINHSDKPFAVVSHYFKRSSRVVTYIFKKAEFHQMPIPGKWTNFDTYIDYFDTRKQCETHIKGCI